MRTDLAVTRRQQRVLRVSRAIGRWWRWATTTPPHDRTVCGDCRQVHKEF